MATNLKVVEGVAEIVPAPAPPEFEIAPTRNQHSGWTAERQRKFIEHLSLTGSVGEAAAIAGVSSRSPYRLRNKAGAESFARAWDAALSLAATRLARHAHAYGIAAIAAFRPVPSPSRVRARSGANFANFQPAAPANEGVNFVNFVGLPAATSRRADRPSDWRRRSGTVPCR